ncbi:MAG: hypothetical protein HY535_06495 [Chloroflexi bacterium]|nr:hypothetical protein [Chloroflexota bacterium]
MKPIGKCTWRFAVLVGIAALTLVAGLPLLGGGRALAQDATIDCSDPANAELTECTDPSSKFTGFTATNPATTLTINWSASAICTQIAGGANSCANNASAVNGAVADGYTVQVWGNSAAAGATTCSTTDSPVGSLFQNLDSTTTLLGTTSPNPKTFTLPGACGDTWFLFGVHPSQSGLGGNGSTWGEIHSDNTAGAVSPPGPYCITVVTTCPVSEEPKSEISTTIHREDTGYSAGPPEVNFTDLGATGGTVTMGATIHDKATVTGTGVTGNPDPTGNVEFTLFSGKTCSGTPIHVPADAGYTVALGAGNPAMAESASYLTVMADVVAGGVSYTAHYVGDTNYPAADSGCEDLTVTSSITGFHYHVIAGFDSGTQTGTYDCTLPASEKGLATACPAGTTEASVTKGQNNDYKVHITVTNNTGVTISEKVQGGLSASPGTSYAVQSISCGSATIDISSTGSGLGKKTSGGTGGNVVTWTIPSMADNTSCDLEVDIYNLKFTGSNQQPVTSSWSEFQCETDGPNSGQCDKSPYTDNLMANTGP